MCIYKVLLLLNKHRDPQFLFEVPIRESLTKISVQVLFQGMTLKQSLSATHNYRLLTYSTLSVCSETMSSCLLIQSNGSENNYVLYTSTDQKLNLPESVFEF